MKPDHGRQEPLTRLRRSRYGAGVLIIGAIAGYFLLKEQTSHVAGHLPLLLLAACPLMHIFMHRGHGHGRHEHCSHGPPDPPHPDTGGNATARDQSEGQS